MPFEDFVGTKLSQGSRLPANLETFDYYDRATQRAISVKTMDTNTMTKLENPNQIYSILKGNIDAMINFTEHRLGKTELLLSEIPK